MRKAALVVAAAGIFATPAAASTGRFYQVPVNDKLGGSHVAVTGDGTVWVSDGKSAVVRLDKSGAQSVIQLGNTTGTLYAEPDNSVWVSEWGALAHLSAGGQVLAQISLPGGGDHTPGAFATGADGALWFTATRKGVIERLDPSSNRVTEYPDGESDPNLLPSGLATGSDGRLWYTVTGNEGGYPKGAVGAISTNGSASIYKARTPTQGTDVTAANGSLWYSAGGSYPLTRLVPGNPPTTSVFKPKQGPDSPNVADTVLAGPDGTLWFPGMGQIGSVSPNGSATLYGKANGWSTAVVSPAAAVAPDKTVWLIHNTTLEHLIPTAPLPCVVPNVTGEGPAQTAAALKSAHCRERHPRITGPRDTPVIATKQSPAANEVIDPTQPVTVTLRRGVPSVLNHCDVPGDPGFGDYYRELRLSCKQAQTIDRHAFVAAMKRHSSHYHSYTCTGVQRRMNVQGGDGWSQTVTCRGRDAKRRPTYLQIVKYLYDRN
ncbi:MAG: hypothetical protein J2O48_00965 [Solirubrobacterales bacterium]|nr:hypothetical protein [Solirubrobacterales bacterium]